MDVNLLFMTTSKKDTTFIEPFKEESIDTNISLLWLECSPMKFRTKKKYSSLQKNMYEKTIFSSNIYRLNYTKYMLVKIILHLPKNYKSKPKIKIG
jgi:hypothetical protein